MIKVTADFSSVDEAAARWKRRSRELDRDVRAAMVSERADIEASAREVTPRRTGNLRRRWTLEPRDGGAVMRNGAKYAGYVFHLGSPELRRAREAIRSRLPSIQPRVVRNILKGA